MRGFTKDGKFRPTGRTKSGIKKSDITKSTRKEVKEGGKTFVKYNYFGKHSAKYEKRTKQSMDDTKELWNNSDDEKRERLIRKAYADLDFPSPLIDSNTGNQIGSLTGRDQVNDLVMIHSKTDYEELPQKVKTRLENLPEWHRTKQSMDEDIVEAKVEDIFDEVASTETGHVHHEKLNKSVHDNIEYILERDHLLKEGDSIFQNVTDLQEETTRKEFEKTGHGESGYYLSQFTVRRNNETIYKGIVEGDITMGALMNMELQMRKV